MVEIKVVKYSLAETNLVNLYRASFGHEINPELWRWKHTDTSATATDPEVIVAVEGDEIVGARPFLFMEMWLANSKVTAAQHCDTMVHPEYQKHGLFNLMGQFSLKYLKENGYALSYGFPNQLSQRGFIKQGYRIIGEKEDMFFLLQPKAYVSKRWKHEFLGDITGPLYDNLLGNKSNWRTKPPAGYQVITSDRFTDELSQVDTLRDKSAIDLARDKRFLRWRFDNHPDFKYRYVSVMREGKLGGYAVIKVREESDGTNQGIIMDYLVKDYEATCFRVLLNGCLEEFDRLNCVSVHTRIIGERNPMRRLFKRAGFRSVLEFPYNKFYHYNAIFDAIQIQDQMPDNTDIYDKENWRVSYAFSDSE